MLRFTAPALVSVFVFGHGVTNPGTAYESRRKAVSQRTEARRAVSPRLE